MSPSSPTLPNLITPHLRERSNLPALIYHGRPVTYADLDAESRRVAAGLRALGVTAGDRVSIWMPNTPAWVAALLACARLGAIAFATNTIPQHRDGGHPRAQRRESAAAVAGIP